MSLPSHVLSDEMSSIDSSLACVHSSLLITQQMNCNNPELQKGSRGCLVTFLGQGQPQSNQSWNSNSSDKQGGWSWRFWKGFFSLELPRVSGCGRMCAVERAAIPSASPSSRSVPSCSSAVCFNSPSPRPDQGPPGYPVIHLFGIWECCFSAPTQVGKRVIKALEINQHLLWRIFRLRALDATHHFTHVFWHHALILHLTFLFKHDCEQLFQLRLY